jgi:hypothetical protein
MSSEHAVVLLVTMMTTMMVYKAKFVIVDAVAEQIKKTLNVLRCLSM